MPKPNHAVLEVTAGHNVPHPTTTTTTGTGQPYPVAVTPTQIRRPWRSTLRTAFQALVALAAMAPVLVATTGLKTDQTPWLVGILAGAATLTRIMALPQVETFLRRFLPWLAAAPRP